MDIILHGASGRMGANVIAAAAKNEDMNIAAKVSPDYKAPLEEGCFLKLTDFTGAADIVIDFSNHAACEALCGYCVQRKLPVIIATTGHTLSEKQIIEEAAEQIPVFFASNMSIGIAVLCSLAKKAAAAFPDADIEVVEAHHNQKLDVPSGTALTLAGAICDVREGSELVIGRHENGKRKKEEIGIHSLRMGNETGMHEIIISTGTETLTLKHEAENRSLFADGALAAARFLIGKNAGLYGMADIVK